MSDDFVRKPGVACSCGSVELRVIVPGDDGDCFGFIVIKWPRPDRVFCSFACAEKAGWPWLCSETSNQRSAVHA